MLFSGSRWPLWLLARRRAMGVAAFGYAALHTLFYLVDLGSLQAVMAKFFALGIWTGWAAFAILVPMALSSNVGSQRLLGPRWKTLQRLIYLAAILTLVHWIAIHNGFAGALAHFVPLGLLEAYRAYRLFNRRMPASPVAL
jgi:sulfoxide reductase heme-binding subunit YedZ